MTASVEFQDYDTFKVEYRDASHGYWIHQDGERARVPSVTTALGCLDKPALIRWAESCGVEGALILERRGELKGVDPQAAADIVRINGLGADRKRDKGADRGSAIHDALKLWAQDGTIPNPADFPAEARGYLSGLFSWLVKANPTPLVVERIVGSPKHRFAGRFDLLAEIDGRRVLVDLKTNPKGRVYDSHATQCAGYALAFPECGIDPVDRSVIVAVGEGGVFSAMDACAEPRDFLAVLECYRAVQRVKSAYRTALKLAEAA